MIQFKKKRRPSSNPQGINNRCRVGYGAEVVGLLGALRFRRPSALAQMRTRPTALTAPWFGVAA